MMEVALKLSIKLSRNGKRRQSIYILPVIAIGDLTDNPTNPGLIFSEKAPFCEQVKAVTR